jgi:alcohol dehydrogenase class IV
VSALAKPFTLRLPVSVESGTGCLKKLPSHLTRNQKALVVTGKNSMKNAGVTDKLAAILSGAGVESALFDELSAEPDYKEIEAAAKKARRIKADVIIGCGGGSAMDAAKLVAIAASHPEPVLAYRVGGTHEITRATLPILLVTSTSGTGSHVGRAAVVTEPEKKIKRFMASDFLYPKAAFCDPEILALMPASLTAASGFDAFAQALEGYLSSADHPMGKFCAQEAIRIISHALPRVFRDGNNLELRAEMAWADTLQGISLATNAVITAHVIAMVLGGRYGIRHAQAVAVVTVAALRHSRNGAVDKLANIARLMGCKDELSQEAMADWAITEIEELIQTIGLGKDLAELGVPSTDYEEIAREVRANFAFRLDSDPVPKQASDVIRILEKS